MTIYKTFAAMEAAAKSGNADAQNQLGTHYAQSKEFHKAFRWHRQAAENNFPEAQYRVGMLLYKGYMGAQPKADGTARRVDPNVQNLLQNLAEITTKATPAMMPDYVQALDWFLQATKHGHAMAETAVGQMYFRGEAVQKNYATSLQWFTSAAAKNEPAAVFMVGMQHFQGYGVKADQKTGRQWFETAAGLGCPEAHMSLGLIHAKGLGVPKDYENAMRWLHNALDHNAPGAFDAIVKLRKTLATEANFKIAKEILRSPQISQALMPEQRKRFEQSHRDGNWGNVSFEQEITNLRALKSGGPLLSQFLLRGTDYIEVETDAPRRKTVIRFKDEPEFKP